MEKLAFRDLTAEEIECRIGSVKSNGLTLLLYKNARVDMQLLDETVGAENWSRSHELIDGNLFCNVTVRFIDENGQPYYITKQDVGKESYTEKEKGRASDSFKRACTCWGIGRELYESPFIWIPSSKCKIDNGKCYDKFSVEAINIQNKKIVGLCIKNETTGERCFSWAADSVKKKGK